MPGSSKAVDPAILSTLNLPPSTRATLTPHGGSGFASSYKLTVTTDKDEGEISRRYFVKTGTGPSSQIMFRGEHASLNAIHSAVPSFCPKSFGFGSFSTSPQKYFLVTDFLDLNPSSGSTKGGTGGKGGEKGEKPLSFAQKLAKLHTTPAPIPEGYDRPMYGFPVPTCCGATEQDNTLKESWAEFYADNRLRTVLRQGIEQNGRDDDLTKTVEAVAGKVVPRLLGEGHLKGHFPVVVHGDLWSGNHGKGIFASSKDGGAIEEVVYDPSCVYGHSEYELGIMKMFGGFGSQFWGEYTKLVKKHEPVEEWDDRVSLYEL